MKRIEWKRFTLTKYGISIMFKEPQALCRDDTLVVEIQKEIGR